MHRLAGWFSLVLLVSSGLGCSDDGEQQTNTGETTTGDGDPTTSGDGDGDPTASGDGDGDPTTGDGDGDGDPTGDGDGDGDPTTTGDGDGDGDGDPITGDGDGDPGCGFDPNPDEFQTFGFIDTPEDDIPQEAIKDFFEGLPELCSSDYMFFQILGGNGQGAWCSSGGDWYVTTYLEVWGMSPTLMTGPFQMWARDGDVDAPWEEALPFPQQNHYGGGCGQFAGDWCSNWGLEGLTLGVMPESPQGLDGSELRDSSPSDGEGWEFTLTWGRSRQAACGF